MAACALVGGTALGAVAEDPDPQSKLKDQFERVFATPRYYAISASGGMKFQDGTKMCLGGEPLRGMFSGIQAIAQDPGTMTQLTKGCTMAREHRATGQFVLKRTCDAAAGAPVTSRMTLSGTLDDLHQHLELQMKGASGQDITVLSDVEMKYLGECPPNVKPGQFLQPDGRISDPLADLKPSLEPPNKPSPNSDGR